MTSEHQPHGKLIPLAIGAIGVVYGDIGTSPLYTMKEIFNGPHAVQPTPDNILGILSLIFWALIFVISIKYVSFVMSASNRGEGGIMALMALALRRRHRPSQRNWIIILGLLGTSLFSGESVITPAISVLSAVEGLEVAAPSLERYVLPLSLAILIGLFMIQRHGTGVIGLAFGPIMCLWFLTLAVLGWHSIEQNPVVLEALNPVRGIKYFLANGGHAFVALGAVVLALTGAEALYADMGHFGKRPIQVAWFALVFPSLLLNYFGQGALILRDHAAIENPFYLLVPSTAMYPMIALATAATVIASQAVISGAFSIASQAMRMDYIPRILTVHTSSAAKGQIFVPALNRTLLLIVIATVLSFKTSGNLAAAYGIAVTGTMVVTTLLVGIVALDSWKWPAYGAGAMVALFLIVDGSFFGANLLKIPQGGWFPAVLGTLVFFVMSTWRRGREVLFHRLQKAAVSLTGFIAELPDNPPLARVPGTAVFMTARHISMPHALQQNFQHNQVLHDRVVLLTVITEDTPYLAEGDRVEVDRLDQGFYRVTAKYGFMETPNVPEILSLCHSHGLDVELRQTSFFIGRETLIPSDRPDLNPWQERLFLAMFRNTSSPIQLFDIPPERVVEVGAQFEV
ncbi:MAG: potassium transporter Kup [Methylococcaceae bacterium]|nr:potassium transporter Kup [Methylococcaceae bacterium]